MKFNMLLFIALLSSFAFAISPPDFPLCEEDQTLFGNKGAAAFFQSRQAQTACRGELAAAQSRYYSLVAKLKQLVLEGAPKPTIKATDSEKEAARKALLLKMESCGDCATRETEQTIIPGGKKQYWYTSDGSCYLRNEISETVDRGFPQIRERFFRVNQYPRYSGGFRNLTEYMPFDYATGAHLTNLADIDPEKPLYTFMAMKGPTILGRSAYGYTFKMELDETSNETEARFTIRYRGLPAPDKYTPPRMKWLTATGDLEPVGHVAMGGANGMFCVTSSGLMRYFSSGEFGLDANYVKQQARTMALDTLVEMTERYLDDGNLDSVEGN